MEVGVVVVVVVLETVVDVWLVVVDETVVLVTLVVVVVVGVVVWLVVCELVTVVVGDVVWLVVGVVISHWVSKRPATYISTASFNEPALVSQAVLSMKNLVKAHEMVSSRPSTGPVTSFIMPFSATAVSSQSLPSLPSNTSSFSPSTSSHAIFPEGNLDLHSPSSLFSQFRFAAHESPPSRCVSYSPMHTISGAKGVVVGVEVMVDVADVVTVVVVVGEVVGLEVPVVVRVDVAVLVGVDVAVVVWLDVAVVVGDVVGVVTSQF